MKNKYFLVCALLLALVSSSCDDSGVGSWPRSGEIMLSLSNFPRIDPNVDGIYEAWVKLDSQGAFIYYSLGRFNVSSNGSIVNPAGSPVAFRLNGDTAKLYLSRSAVITVEPPGDFDPYPSSRILISSQLSIGQDSIYGTMTLSGSEALGDVGRRLMSGDFGAFIFDTPTDNNMSCFRGIWFCDSNGNSSMPQGLALSTGSPWIYEAWVADTSELNNPIYYSLGRFSDPYGPDQDGAGACAGPEQPYLKPGQDWVLYGCPPGKPQIVNLRSGIYWVFITVEPQDEMPGSAAYQMPFPLKLFATNFIHPTTLCRTVSWMTYVLSWGPFPSARLKITYHLY